MLVQPPVVLLRRPCAGIQRGARPIVDDAMVLVEIRAKHPVLIDLQMQEIQPVVLVAEAGIPSVGTRMRLAFRIDPARPPLWGDHFWSPSYCVVSCGGAPLEIIKRYIQDQQKPNRKYVRRS